MIAPPAGRGGGRGGPVLSPEQQQLIQQGGEVYGSLCFTCHNEDGRGRPLAGAANGAMMAPPLAGSPRVNGHRDYVIKTLLKGLTGPHRRREIFRSDGADGHEHGSVDRGGRLLRAHEFRQRGRICDPR